MSLTFCAFGGGGSPSVMAIAEVAPSVRLGMSKAMTTKKPTKELGTTESEVEVKRCR